MRARGGLISTATTADQFPITDRCYFHDVKAGQAYPPPPQDSIDEECLFDSKAPRSELMDELN